jgi:FKBP-type peptidyl-prolyl cis-trans isomerase
MKYVLATIFGIGLLFAFCFGGETLELKDRKDKESYSLGYQFGQNLKSQGVEINLDVYTSALKDALAGAAPRLSKEEIHKTITELRERVAAAHQTAPSSSK